MLRVEPLETLEDCLTRLRKLCITHPDYKNLSRLEAELAHLRSLEPVNGPVNTPQ